MERLAKREPRMNPKRRKKMAAQVMAAQVEDLKQFILAEPDMLGRQVRLHTMANLMALCGVPYHEAKALVIAAGL